MKIDQKLQVLKLSGHTCFGTLVSNCQEYIESLHCVIWVTFNFVLMIFHCCADFFLWLVLPGHFKILLKKIALYLTTAALEVWFAEYVSEHMTHYRYKPLHTCRWSHQSIKLEKVTAPRAVVVQGQLQPGKSASVLNCSWLCQLVHN